MSISEKNAHSIYLLDGMALVYRAYFSMLRTNMANSKGINTAPIYGFCNTLLDLLNNKKPSHIAVAFDTSAPTARHKVFPEYKAQRDKMPEDLQVAIPWIKKIISAFNIVIIEKDGYEADDVIGTIAKSASSGKFKNSDGIITSYMVTPDKDFAQLIDEHIYMYKPARSGGNAEIIGTEEIKKIWQIDSPTQVIDILALWGDAVDNIPGVPGIGEKTAKTLIGKYGSIENLVEHLDEQKGKQKENLANNIGNLQLYKELVTIDTNVPLENLSDKNGEIDFDFFLIKERNDAEIMQICQELEFRTLGKRLFGKEYTVDISANKNTDSLSDESSKSKAGGNSKNENESEGEQEIPTSLTVAPVFLTEAKSLADFDVDYQRITAEDDAKRKEVLARFSESEKFCFDLETTSLNTTSTKILGLALSNKNQQAFYIEFPQDKTAYQEILAEVKSVLQSPKALKIGHNLKFDLSVLIWNGIAPQEPYFDTMLAHILLEPGQRHKMDILAQRFLNYKPIAITELIGEKKGKVKQLSMLSAMEAQPEKVARYACEDADITWQLYRTFAPRLEVAQGMKEIFYKIESPLLPTLVSMERNGIKIDTAIFTKIANELRAELLDLEKAIYELAGVAFNINSPKQMGEVLFGRLKLEKDPKKTASGQFKTDEQTLQSLLNRHEIVEKILDYRKSAKLMNTYVEVLPKQINPQTGKIHTTFTQLAAVTGRVSSDKPNLQNIPIRTEQGKKIRSAFVASDDEHVLLSADYSQIELRIMAHLSQDENMIADFKKGLDIHTATAAKVYGVKLDEVLPEMRRTAKMVNFGMIYGISAFGLAQRLNIARKEAGEIIKTYFNQYKGVKNFMEEVVAEARKKGYVETILGRRRYLRDINSRNAIVRKASERNAINTPVQGSAADMIKLAMVAINRELNQRNFKAKMLLQVHDELVFDCLIAEKDEVSELIIAKMTSALPLSLPVLVEIGSGKNWLTAH